MLTTKQLRILNLFGKNLFKEYSFKELKKSSKEKSNSVLQNAVRQFLKERLIIERKIGTSKLYMVNHENDKFYAYLDIIIKESLPMMVKKSIEVIKQELNNHTYFYSIVIFGSYAIKEQKEASDLDVAVFIEKEAQKKAIQTALDSAGDKILLKLDGHAITKDEFLEMLKVDYANLGKEIAKNHLTVHSPCIFYALLKEGIKNGFRL